MNYWAMVFPCLLYLASVGTYSSPPQVESATLINAIDVAMGGVHIYERLGTRANSNTLIGFTTSYLSICLSLNVLLTLMIVIRLMIHVRSLRKATGASSGSSGLHTATATVITMLIESYALYAVALLAYLIPWAIESWVTLIFTGTVGTIQVCPVSTSPRCAPTPSLAF